jgi:hypothetical protein
VNRDIHRDTKRLCWDNENSPSINIGINRGEFLHVVFADSNFPTIYQRNGLDIYALSSTTKSLYRLVKLTLAQDAFGIGDFTIDVTKAYSIMHILSSCMKHHRYHRST